MTRLASLCALLCNGCALQLEVPRRELPQPRPRSQPALGSLTLAVDLDAATLAAAIEGATLQPARFGQSSALVGAWSLQVERRGPAGVSVDGGRLCVRMPFAGQGQLNVLGRNLDHALTATVEVCATPRVRPDGDLSLIDAEARIDLGRDRLELATRVLSDALQRYLSDAVAAALRARAEALRVPLATLLRPRLAVLVRPIALDAAEGAAGPCLRVRPERLWLGQPVAEAGRLRLPARLDGRPDVAWPCGVEAGDDAEGSAAADRIAVAGDPDLRALPLALTLPLAVRLDSLAPRAEAALRARGAVALAGSGAARGHVTLSRPRLGGSGDRLVIGASVTGEVSDRWLGIIPLRREVRGELALWGRPQLEADAIGLAELRVDLRGGDRAQAIAVALQRDRLGTALRAALRVPTAGLLGRADAMLAQLGRGVALPGGVALPVRVDRKELAITGARVEGGWLLVAARFVGHVVVGGPALPAAAPAVPPRRRR